MFGYLSELSARGLGRAFGVALLLAAATQAAGLPLNIDGRDYDWSHVGRFVLPGDTVSITAPAEGGPCGWAASGGELAILDQQRVRWVAPGEPGLHSITVCRDTLSAAVNVFVMVPFDSMMNGELNGYRIGTYPSSNPFPNFVIPRGFIEVTEENIDTRVSRGHTLREFVSRQPGSFPKYLVLREELVIKLELLADLVREKGHDCEALTVFSGFRTPSFHHRRGSGTNSAHVYGGAADIFLDGNDDGLMDDISGDGASDSRDSRLLASYVDELEEAHPELVGGCGWYRRTRSRGPFVHTDVRGERTRWHR